MKKLVWLLVALLISTAAYAEVKFDISVFENSGKYDIEFDDMNDTGEITPKDGGLIFGTPTEPDSDEGMILGTLDIKMLEGEPPVIRLGIFYIGEDWIFTDKAILKPADTRYTFEVDPNTDVNDGKVYEQFALVITDENISMIEDIANGNIASIRCRLSGKRDVDFNLVVNPDAFSDIYDLYLESGAPDNDFSKIKVVFPCEIK